MSVPEKQVGRIAIMSGKYYTPKYWVAKLRTDTDVLIKTASKNLSDAQELAWELYSTEMDRNEIIFISIQISNTDG